MTTGLLDRVIPAGGLFRYRTLVRNLVAKDITVKYRRSFLGVLWSLLHPALMLAVYTFAFKLVLRVQAENSRPACRISR